MRMPLKVGMVCSLLICWSVSAGYVPDVVGVPLGGGWCRICGRDQPAGHDFTHGMFSGGGSGGITQRRHTAPEPQYDRDAEAKKHCNIAIDHFNAGRWKEAYMAAHKALTHKWEYAKAHYVWSRAAHIYYSGLDSRGIDHLATDWRRAVINGYLAALEYDPGLSDVRIWLEQLRQEVAKEEKRRQELWKAMHREIMGDQAYNEGMNALSQKNWKDAEGAFRLALSHNPSDFEACWKLGYVLIHLDRLREAENAYRKGIQLNSTDPTAYEGLAWLLKRLRKHKEAVTAARNAIRLSPNSVAAHRTLASSLWSLGDKAEAEAEYRKVIELDPGTGQAYSSLATLLLEQGKSEEAETLSRKALEIDPSDWWAQHNLGKIKFDGWAPKHEAQRPAYKTKVQNILQDIIHSDTSVVDLRNLSEQGGASALFDGSASSGKSLKLIDVPSPAGYRSEQERRQQLAKLTDKQIDTEIERMGRMFERMKVDFEKDPKALEKYLLESQDAEREALMTCFQSMLSGSIKKWDKHWGKYPKAKKLAEEGLRYLGYEKPVKDYLKSPEDTQANLQMARTYLVEVYGIVSDIDPEEFTAVGVPAVSLVNFLVDYSYQVSRWAAARRQIRIISDNLDDPKGKLQAQKAIRRVHEDMIKERNRRRASRPLMPKGIDE